MPAPKSVALYIAALGPKDGWKFQTATELHELITRAAPKSTNAIKWAQPVYEDHGPFCYFKAFKNHINLGFWRGAELPDPKKLLTGTGEKMRHLKIIESTKLSKTALTVLIKKAVSLNRAEGDPTKS